VAVVPPVSTGDGALKAAVAPVTVNGSVLVVPIGVVAVTVLAVSAAPGVMAQFALTVVAVEVIPVQVMPPPEKVTAVAPVRLVPASATGTVVPRLPVAGVMPVSVGPCTVNGTVWVLVPDPVEMLAFLVAVVEAVAVMAHVAVAVSGSRTVMPLQVTPPPEIFTAVAPVKLVPVSVTATDVPRTPVLGAIEANVGAGRAMTVKATALLVPPGTTVTVTFLAVPVAVGLIVKVALTCESLIGVTPLTVKPPPPPPETVTAVAPVSPLPKRLTGIVCPRTAWTGEIESSTGPPTV